MTLRARRRSRAAVVASIIAVALSQLSRQYLDVFLAISRKTRRTVPGLRASWLGSQVCGCNAGPQQTISGKPVALDRLCYNWSIFQVRDGYRFNGDDILLAHEALRAAPGALRLLDLGAGTGSVGLLWLAQKPQEASLTLVEAQDESVDLCHQSIARLGLEDRVDVRLGDLRQLAMPVGVSGSTFDIITANPPYHQPSGRKLPQHSQRCHCYYELRGGLADFASAAARLLKVDGVFCMVHMSSRGEDAAQAAKAAGFSVERRLTAFARGEPKWVVLTCRKVLRSPAETNSVAPEEETLVVRDLDGNWTQFWDDICREMGTFQLPGP